jgi:hypothetical protein
MSPAPRRGAGAPNVDRRSPRRPPNKRADLSSNRSRAGSRRRSRMSDDLAASATDGARGSVAPVALAGRVLARAVAHAAAVDLVAGLRVVHVPPCVGLEPPDDGLDDEDVDEAEPEHAAYGEDCDQPRAHAASSSDSWITSASSRPRAWAIRVAVPRWTGPSSFSTRAMVRDVTPARTANCSRESPRGLTARAFLASVWRCSCFPCFSLPGPPSRVVRVARERAHPLRSPFYFSFALRVI